MINYNELKKIIEELSKEEIILLAGHKNTDYDSICSSLALTIFLNKIGYKAFMLLEENDIPKLNWYGKFDYVVSEFDINNKYNFLLLDSNRKSRLGIFEEYFDKANIKINIDHHEDNKNESDYIFVDKEISSTCEIIFNLLNLFKNKIDKDIATLLYAGIVCDTNCFYNRVTSNTMKTCSELLKYNIDSSYIIKSAYKNISMNETKILIDMLNNLKREIFYYIIMDRQNELYSNVDYSVIFKKCASYIYDIIDIDVLGLFLKELDGSISGLFRSNCDIDVDELATSLGGGGHKKASGFENNMDIEEILNISKEYIKKNR